jgi:PHD/YefM family antitoxin component YafN of YafNO toxin-antitoxin module
MKIKEQFIIDPNGKKTAVVLPVKEYERLLEDLHDLSVVAERRREPTINLEELKRRLKKDGLI